MANKFQIYASSLDYVYTDDNTYEQSTFRQSGGVPNNTASAFAVNTALYCASIICKSIIDAMITNTNDVADYGIDDADDLTDNLIVMLSNLNVKTAARWATPRSISIASHDGTGASTGVNVDGSGNTTLKLPDEIKADLHGDADNALKIGGKTFQMSFNSTTGVLDITYTD